MKSFARRLVKIFLIILGLSLSAPAFSQTVGPRCALVIGNGAYRHVASLPNTVNDATGIARKLSGLGYTVELLFDSDLAGIVYGSYPLGRLLLSLEQTARNKLNVVVLDACRDNPFKNIPGTSRGLSRSFVTVEHPPQDIFVMFSTSPGTTAADGEDLKPAYTITGQTVNWDRSANGYRLPTDAEWEYACRSGTATPLFTGESISTSQANYNGSVAHNYGNRGLFRKATVSAGSFPPNAWGLYDMHGNVWEWCWDYYSNPNTTPLTDPAGPASGTHRINRGGSWSSSGKLLRSAVRASDFPETAGSNLGFRLAKNK